MSNSRGQAMRVSYRGKVWLACIGLSLLCWAGVLLAAGSLIRHCV